MEQSPPAALRRYTVDQLAHDIGRTVCPALTPIIKNVLGDEVATWADRWDASHKREVAGLRKAIDERDLNVAAREREHQQEIEAVRAECEQRLHDQEARHRENLAQLQRAHEDHVAALTRMGVPAVDMAARPVTIPHTGQVPAMLHDVKGPLFRIRWQHGQAAGEGEPWSIPEGFVLDDDQSGTWLDHINATYCTGL